MFLLPKSHWEIKTRVYEDSNETKFNRGVFAKKDIVSGTIIGDYLGLLVPAVDEDKYEDDDELYLMYYSEDATIMPDPKKPGIHILNHSCMPNCGMYTYMGHTVYFALRKIFNGEELTVSYQLHPKDKDCNPCTDACYCATPICTGTQHLTKHQYKKWIAFEEKESAKTKTAPATIKKSLPKLATYPKKIEAADVYGIFGSFEKEPLVLTEKKLPKKTDLRLLIQKTGKTIITAKKHILGVHNNRIITLKTN